LRVHAQGPGRVVLERIDPKSGIDLRGIAGERD
jgi:hypothetical protein